MWQILVKFIELKSEIINHWRMKPIVWYFQHIKSWVKVIHIDCFLIREVLVFNINFIYLSLFLENKKYIKIAKLTGASIS